VKSTEAKRTIKLTAVPPKPGNTATAKATATATATAPPPKPTSTGVSDIDDPFMRRKNK
jgi:hypothetical protein